MHLRAIRMARALIPALIPALLASAAASDAPRDRPLPPWSTAAGHPLHIVAFGSSLTAGGTWPGDLARALEACLQGQVTLEVIAAPGAGSSWGLETVDRVRATAPDLVLLEFAINDADLRDGVGLSRSARQHREILRDLLGDAPQRRVLLMTMNPVSGLIRKLQRPRLGRYYALYPDLAAEADTGLVDFATRWQADPEHLRASLSDGLHPRPEAASALMVPLLLQAIAGARGAHCPA
jgi:lysophospholipase L1-like esterase